MIEWNEEHNVNISIIDEVHTKFIDIINKAAIAKQHKNHREKILEILNEMTTFALKHFTTEESYMIKFNYPEYQYHKMTTPLLSQLSKDSIATQHIYFTTLDS